MPRAATEGARSKPKRLRANTTFAERRWWRRRELCRERRLQAAARSLNDGADTNRAQRRMVEAAELNPRPRIRRRSPLRACLHSDFAAG